MFHQLNVVSSSIYLILDLSSGGAEAWTYSFSTSPSRRWPDARKWCQQHFIDMAPIQNQEESDFLNDLLPFNSKYYWIGVHKDSERWLWSPTSVEVPQEAQNWAPEEPDSITGQDCVEMYVKRPADTAKWNNERCSKKKGTVCYSGKTLYSV